MKTPVGVLLAAVLALGFGCARPDWIEQTLVTVDVTGTRSGSTQKSELLFELEQEGPKVKGFMIGWSTIGGGSGQAVKGRIVGTVAGDVFSFAHPNGDWKGELVISGDEMEGQVTMTENRLRVVLRRVNPSSPPTPQGQ
jgi:hypothetical protein